MSIYIVHRILQQQLQLSVRMHNPHTNEEVLCVCLCECANPAAFAGNDGNEFNEKFGIVTRISSIIHYIYIGSAAI